jgi:hypothetical protein
MDPLTAAAPIVTSTLSGLNAIFTFVQLAYRIHGVDEDCLIFAKLVDQVQCDLQHALEVRSEVVHLLEMYPDSYRLWIKQSLVRTLDTLDDFGKYILKVDPNPNRGSDLSLRKRIEYLLNNYQKLVDREKSLRFAHSSLLTAINTMDFMLIQSRMFANPGSAPASSSGTPSGTVLRRASRQPPVPKEALSRPSSAPPIREEDNKSYTTSEHPSSPAFAQRAAVQPTSPGRRRPSDGSSQGRKGERDSQRGTKRQRE